AGGARLIGVPSDDEGPSLAALEPLGRAGAKGLYLMPNSHNPTGAQISAARREALLDWSRRYGVPLIEDDYVSDLDLDDAPRPPPAGAARARRGRHLHRHVLQAAGPGPAHRFPGLPAVAAPAPDLAEARHGPGQQRAPAAHARGVPGARLPGGAPGEDHPRVP